MLTERQVDILNSVIGEYIKLAAPVSSHLLKKGKGLKISPATIRNEMQELTNQGYLYQPHTSAGRVPTDKGYRFFVDKLLGQIRSSNIGGLRSSREHLGVFLMREITRFLAEESSDLAVGYSTVDKIFWKEGWQDIFEEPEFEEPGLAAAFARMIDDFEESVDAMLLHQTKVYIGRENPFSKTQDFSIILSGFGDGVFAILGPKRMSYDKNINLIQTIWQKI